MRTALKFADVKRALLQDIERIGAGARIPSTDVLHTKFGVSRGTVDRAIRDLVDDGVLERFSGRGTFVTTRRASSGAIALVWPGYREWLPDTMQPYSESVLREIPYTIRLLHGIEFEARSRGRRVLVAATADWQYLPFLDDHENIDGVIVLCNPEWEIPERYAAHGVGVVLVDPLVRHPGFGYVSSDNFMASYVATRHLIEMGHRSIVQLSTRWNVPMIMADERYLGYAAAMREARLDDQIATMQLPPAPVKHDHMEIPRADAHGQPQERFGAAAVNDCISFFDRQEASGCVCFDDSLASWLLQICHDAGVAVPLDLSIVGINDTGLAAHLWPPLTTVHLSMERVGQTAVRMLDRTLAGDTDVTNLLVPGWLVKRQSVRKLNACSAMAVVSQHGPIARSRGKKEDSGEEIIDDPVVRHHQLQI